MQSQAGADPIDITITWQTGLNSLGSCGAACYFPIASPYGVFIPDSAVGAPDIVVHEIAHRYRHGVMGWWFFGDVSYYFWCTSHGIFDVLYDSRCAFAEGWADYFPLVVNGDGCFDFETNGPCDGGSNSVDLEYQGWGDGRPIGDQVEGRVAGALYDVTDDNNEGFDDRWDSFWAVWTVLGDLPPVYTALGFYTSWMGREEWALQAPLTMRFYNNTIEYFKIGLPMVLRAEGSSGIPATPTPTPPPTVTPTPFDSPLPTPTSFQSPLATPTPPGPE